MEKQDAKSLRPDPPNERSRNQLMPPVRTKMVGWYDPGQLVRTALKVLASTIFGEHSDYRILESLSASSNKIYDYTTDDQGKLRNEIWIDYLADTGDGWNSTYAVAYAVGQSQLKLKKPDLSYC